MITLEAIKAGFLPSHRVIKLVLFMLLFVCHWFVAHTQVYYDDTELTVEQGTVHTILVDNLEWTWKKTSATIKDNVIQVQEPQIDASGNGTVEIGLLAKKFDELNFENAARVVYAVKAKISGTDVTYEPVDNYNVILTVDGTDTDPIVSTDMGQVFWMNNVTDINNVRSVKSNGPSRMTGGEGSAGIEMTSTPHGFGPENILEKAPSAAESQVTDVTELTSTEASPLLSESIRQRPAGISEEGAMIPSEDTWPEESGENDPFLPRGTGPTGGNVPFGPSTPSPILSIIYIISGVVAIVTIGTSIHLVHHYLTSGSSDNKSSHKHKEKSKNDNSQSMPEPGPQPKDLLAYIKVTGDVTLASVKIPGIEYPIVFQPPPTY